MSGRRNSTRYQLSVPREGELVLAHDVIVESRTEDEVLVLSDAPHPRGQELTLELGTAVSEDGIHAQVVECEPVVVDGSLRYRLRFAIGVGIKRDDASV
jgi:hypothetical protein